MSNFLQAVTVAFESLLHRGLLSVESSDHDAEAFGNAVVVLAGQNLRVRMVRDRGEVFAEAASRLDPGNWFPLQRVIRAIGVSAAPAEGLLTPEEASRIVEQFFTDLERGFGAKSIAQTKTMLSELERFAMKRMIDRTKNEE